MKASKRLNPIRCLINARLDKQHGAARCVFDLGIAAGVDPAEGDPRVLSQFAQFQDFHTKLVRAVLEIDGLFPVFLCVAICGDARGEVPGGLQTTPATVPVTAVHQDEGLATGGQRRQRQAHGDQRKDRRDGRIR